MFKNKKNKLIYINIMLASIFFVSCTKPAQANNINSAAPLHIKINPHISQKQGSRINIIKGLTPIKIRPMVKPSSHHEEISTVEKINHTQLSNNKINDNINSPKIINTTPIYGSTKLTKLNQYKNLADSLKAYLKHQNRDTAIIDAIYDASVSTNVDFKLLLVKALIESDLGRITLSPSSSARGIFQYIEPTWLTLVKRYSDKIGYSFSLSDEKMLNLRYDYRLSALIKANQIKEETRFIERIKHNGRASATDHYIIHMLGQPLASKFYKLLNNKSGVILANYNKGEFKRAAKLNPFFFYNKNGKPLTVAKAYKQFHKKISQSYKRLSEINSKYGNNAI